MLEVCAVEKRKAAARGDVVAVCCSTAKGPIRVGAPGLSRSSFRAASDPIDWRPGGATLGLCTRNSRRDLASRRSQLTYPSPPADRAPYTAAPTCPSPCR
jgi:hypothetical protein